MALLSHSLIFIAIAAVLSYHVNGQRLLDNRLVSCSGLSHSVMSSVQHPLDILCSLMIYICLFKRTFTIDYDNNTFLRDGAPFQYIAGSFHYFRALPQAWSSILKSMRAAGLNAITTYVPILYVSMPYQI